MLKLFVICVFQKCLVIVLLVKLMEKQENDKLITNNLQWLVILETSDKNKHMYNNCVNAFNWSDIYNIK
jgi:hypothetical protein